MLGVLSDSFMLATRMDGFSYVNRPDMAVRHSTRPKRLAAVRRVLAQLF